MTHSPLGKALGKQKNGKHGEKQADALKSLESRGKESRSIENFISARMLNTEIINKPKNRKKKINKMTKNNTLQRMQTYI